MERPWVGLVPAADTLCLASGLTCLWMGLLWSLSLSIRDVRAGHVWRSGSGLRAPGSVWAAPAADAVPEGIRAGLPHGAAVEHRQLSKHLRCPGGLKLPRFDDKPCVVFTQLSELLLAQQA